MAEQAMKQRRPFHESIVDAIHWVDNFGELNLIAKLIKETKIPKDHDKITAAWNRQLQEMGLDDRKDRGVLADLFEQKQEAEKKEKEKKAKEQMEASAL